MCVSMVGGVRTSGKTSGVTWNAVVIKRGSSFTLLHPSMSNRTVWQDVYVAWPV